MVWNKTPPEKINSIVLDLKSDYSRRYQDIADTNEVSECLVSRIAREHLTREEKAERYSAINRYAKLKSNHMTGKTREKHHNSKEVVLICGYLSEWAPYWWTGLEPKGNRVFTHQRVWCEANGQTQVNHGCVIHHIDEDKHNNKIDNLLCLTRREHAQIHCISNFFSKRNDYPKGVESSALEAQRHLLGV